MRFLSVVALTAIASYGSLQFMPWWIPMLIGFCLILVLPMRKNWQSFLATGSGAALCYTWIALFTDQANEHILSRKMAVLFHLPSYVLMIVITVMVGFFTAGLGGWTASALRRSLRNKNLRKMELAGEKSSS